LVLHALVNGEGKEDWCFFSMLVVNYLCHGRNCFSFQTVLKLGLLWLLAWSMADRVQYCFANVPVLLQKPVI